MDGFAPVAGISHNGMAQFASQGEYVEFYSRAEHNQERSQAEGRPIYEARDFVKVMFPGERDCVDRAVNEMDKPRWPRQWAAYQNKREQAPEGTPVDTLFPQSPELVATMRHLKFFTVEQLAGASDTALQSIGMGSRDFQAKAKKFLEAAKSAEGFHKLEAQLASRDTRISQLEDIVKRLQAKDDAEKRGK